MEWKEVRLGDVCSKIGSGATPSGGKEAYKGGDYHLIRSQNVLDFAFSKDGLASINDEQANKLKNVEIIQGDVLLNITGDSVARCCIVPSEILPARVNQHVAIIRPRKEELDNNYLLYYLQYNKRQLLQIASAGATRNAITKAMIENLILPCPKSLEDQRRIVSILSSLDRKIELNNKINADLEEMAQAIFKNWFVDFEPFKDGKFVDSELGMIPEGWKVGTIGDIVEFQNGFAFSSKNFSENGEYKIITIKSVQDGCLVTEGSSKVIEYPTKMPTYCKLQSGDILLSLTGNVGRCCLVTETNLLLNQRVAKIKAKECYDNSFSYALFRLKETKELLISISRGTAQANLSPVEASKLPMVIPSEDARKNFSMISDSIMDKIISIHIENSRLSLLRDTLLPRLMSGELEVPE